MRIDCGVDYVKTAKAIAENIGLIPRNSPEGTAIDCEVVRVSSTWSSTLFLILVCVSWRLLAWF
jgi:hypothetical protein